MSLISVSNVSYSLGEKILFDKLSFAINPAERTALVGLNGAGKSTLLSILSGELEADEGVVARRSGVVIEHVPQLMPTQLRGVTLFEALSHKIPEALRYEGSEYLIDQRLRAAGFQPKQYRQPLGTLSGGEANRALMARALMSEPDLVLLDEPTNHMDIKQVAAFERFVLEELLVAVLIVSHDRALLDAVTSHTLFLRDKRIYAFNLQFSEARKALRASDAAAVERRRSEERELDRLRESAKRLAEWGKVYSNEKFSYRAKSMQKRIEKLEDQVTEVSQGRRGNVSLDTIPGNSGFVVEINDFVIRAPQGHSLSYIDRLAVRRGERLAVTGQNGCGKSTFLKALVAQLSGETRVPNIRYNPSAKLGYYDQELSHFAPGERIAAAVQKRCSLASQQITVELVTAGFEYARHTSLISTLSGGEKARLTFLLLKLIRPHLLILDEPTNHLDLEGIEQLEDSLTAGNNTVIFVSHDRTFLERVATRVVELPAAAKG